jgi:hypothetical protein
MKNAFVILCFILPLLSVYGQENFTTKHVIVVVMDGARYQETFGDSTRQYIPNLNRLKSDGVVYTNFSNNGATLTNSGHAAILTGHYKKIKNNGTQLPSYPNLFQYFLKEKNKEKTNAWIVSSKSKLEMLANTTDKKWWNRYMPMTYCGVKGHAVEYEGDNKNFEKVKEVILNDHPTLMLVNYLEADAKGHNNNWEGYLGGIINIDFLVGELWDFVQNDSIMRNTTTILVTNDHGRHNDGHKEGFKEHGDNCSGCRHIFLFGIGPDFKQNVYIDQPAELIDISSTIAYLLNFNMPTSKGRILTEMFK